MLRHEFLIRAGSVVCGLAVLLSFANSASAVGPFAELAGHWRGSGSVTTSGGIQEAIRCKATYAVNAIGNTMDVNVDCASDSYRVNLISSVSAQNGELSGSWQETTRQIQGQVAGRIRSDDTFQATLQAMGGAIQLAVRTSGKRQAITITAQGSDIQGVSITLRKA